MERNLIKVVLETEANPRYEIQWFNEEDNTWITSVTEVSLDYCLNILPKLKTINTKRKYRLIEKTTTIKEIK